MASADATVDLTSTQRRVIVSDTSSEAMGEATTFARARSRVRCPLQGAAMFHVPRLMPPTLCPASEASSRSLALPGALSFSGSLDSPGALSANELTSAPPYTPIDTLARFRQPRGGDPMLRKVLHLAYHFVTVADEVPRHLVHTN
jgi:hypothetical protein